MEEKMLKTEDGRRRTDWRTSWYAEFMNWLEKFSENTKQAYSRGMGTYVIWFENEMDEEFEPVKLYGADVERWKKADCNENPNTFNLRLASLRELVKCGMAKGWLSFDPLAEVESKQEQTLAPKWLTKGERGKLLRQVAADVQVEPGLVRNQAAIHLMVYAGLRVGEVETLLWEDVTIRERSGHVVVHHGKGNKKRIVPLNLECRKSLEKWCQMTDDEVPGDGGVSVFGASKRTIQRWVESAGEACGVVVSAHDLRHTCAKSLVDSGVGLEVVAALLGHSSLETTRRYVTPGLDDLQAAVDRI